MSIRCGHCHQNHPSAQEVRQCSLGAKADPCFWLVNTGQYDEDGAPIIIECGAPRRETGRGWTCAAGHEHVRAEVTHAEGWAYVTEDEADGYARNTLRTPVLMDGEVWRG